MTLNGGASDNVIETDYELKWWRGTPPYLTIYKGRYAMIIRRKQLFVVSLVLYLALSGCEVGIIDPDLTEIETSDPSYTRFGLNGGYPPGSIVSINDDGSITAARLDRDNLLKALAEVNGDSSYLDYEKRNFNDREYHSTETFKRDASASIGYRGISASAKGRISEIKKVSLVVQGGHKLEFKHGTLGITNALRQLNLGQLQNMRNDLDGYLNLHLITEIVTFGSGTLTASWDNEVGGEAQLEIKSLFELGGSAEFTDNKTLRIQFREDVEVEFKSDQMSIEDIDALICEKTLGPWTVKDMLEGRGPRIVDESDRVKTFSHTFATRGLLVVRVNIDAENKSGVLKIYNGDDEADRQEIELKQGGQGVSDYFHMYEASAGEIWTVEFKTHTGNTLNPNKLKAEVATYGCL